MLKTNKRFIILLIISSLFAIFKNNTLLYLYFILIFIDEINKLINKNYLGVIQQIIMMTPLMGITVVNKVPLGNLYIAIFSIYILLFEHKYAHSKNTIFIFLLFIISDLTKYLLYNNNIKEIINIINIPIFYLSIYAGIIIYEIIIEKKYQDKLSNSFIKGVLLSII